MKELLEYIIKSMISVPDDFSVETEEEDNLVTYNVSLNDADKGVVIGKEGRTIKSIRSILAVVAMQQDKKVYIKIID